VGQLELGCSLQIPRNSNQFLVLMSTDGDDHFLKSHSKKLHLAVKEHSSQFGRELELHRDTSGNRPTDRGSSASSDVDAPRFAATENEINDSFNVTYERMVADALTAVGREASRLERSESESTECHSHETQQRAQDAGCGSRRENRLVVYT
jgi:hypothetical protein